MRQASRPRALEDHQSRTPKAPGAPLVSRISGAACLVARATCCEHRQIRTPLSMRPRAEASIPTPRQTPARQGFVTWTMTAKGMPVDTQAGLVAEFEKYIERYGWNAGVTSDPQRRLFRQHRVHRDDAAWI